MARPIRVEFEGAVYHVTARGNERKAIYRGDDDRRMFLETLEEAAMEHGLRIHGYCLMPNHYHLLVETPRGNLSRTMGWLQTTYSIRFNHRYRRSGHLFQGRFKAHLVEADSYARELLRYVHLNPVRPRKKGQVIPADRRKRFSEYAWSSHRAYTGEVPATAWLCMDWLSLYAARRPEAQRRYRHFVDEAFGNVVESPWEQLRSGLVLGSEAMLKRVRKILREKPGEEEVRWTTRMESGEERAVAARRLAQALEEREWQVWVRVRLGAERRIDVARSYGYRDGSAITQILKRLEKRVQTQPELLARMSVFRRDFAELSSVKS